MGWRVEEERERSVTRLDEVQPLLDIFDQLIDEGGNEWRHRFGKFFEIFDKLLLLLQIIKNHSPQLYYVFYYKIYTFLS